MKSFLPLLFILHMTQAQLISLNFDETNELNYIKSVLTSVSLGSGNHANIDQEGKRFIAGVSLVYTTGLSGLKTGEQYRGCFPSFTGRLLISNNFYFQGKLSGFSSDDGLNQLTGWGFVLHLSDDQNQSQWKLSSNFSIINSPRNLHLRGVDVCISNERKFGEFMWSLGMGKNNFNARVYSDNLLLYNIQDENNYIQFGSQIQFAGITLIPQIKYHPNVVSFTINLLRTFY